ncbi:pentatricopeptide repeat-containing protein At2g22410, mitochondrial-like [Diospyros lotus]|uniref:pentatricopeptide repeat-containing protein At2g22410, mitochondrial-like n=1 Tax=Diospyros lotus TaxID=55363 RepID=UPI0022561162|nr:pentatricopeptide repeat-containing protein At2g22410, mitochondrial-like [Diospyros lotus]
MNVILLSLRESPHSIKQLDQILTQTITTGLILTTPVWNCILRAYSKSPKPTIAILIYNHLIRSNSIRPDNYTFPALLRACSCMPSLSKGKEIHAHIAKVGLDSDVYVQNAFIHLYGSTGQIVDAQKLFDKMSHRDLVSWNSLLAAYCSNSALQIKALALFKQMVYEGIGVDKFTLVIILSVLVEVRRAGYGAVVHGHVIKVGLACILHLENTLLNVYVKCGNMNAALKLYNEMGDRRDIVSHTVLINGYVEAGFVDSARDIFDWTIVKDKILWNSMIHGYVEAKRPRDALELFMRMENEMVRPDEMTIVSILAVCACSSNLQYGRLLHRLILRSNMTPDVFIGTALIDMYSKCGSLDEAMLTFYKMAERDVFTWTAAIAGLANYGYANEALKLFDQMEDRGVDPNEATFVSVLAACRQSGLVNEGCLLFGRMVRFYNIQPKVEHFGCLIDLLGRAGLVDKAEEFIKTMPLGERPIAYKTLLSACISYSKIDLGLKVVDELSRLGSNDHSVYILLSNFYALAGEWSKVADMRRNLKRFGLAKAAGISSLEVKT